MKLSIVTPVYNSAKFLAETIESVINQKGDFYIEYRIIDNSSIDASIEIANKYKKLLAENPYLIQCNGINIDIVSELDDGMYDAINKGFEKATGDIYAWINADDIYLPGAFATIVKVFTSYEDTHWLKGVTSYITEESTIWKVGSCLLYSQAWIQTGIYGRDLYFIQQDSVFWRAWLWKQSGGIDTNYKLAGDYYLWVKFSKLAPLISVRAWVSCFRRVHGQLSSDHKTYQEEVNIISPGNNETKQIKYFFRVEKKLPDILKKLIFKVSFNQPEFTLIIIKSDGVMRRIIGKYYDLIPLL